MYAPRTIGIIGTGSYLPDRVVDNGTVGSDAGVTAEWIERKTGIVTRHRAAPDEAASDLASAAAERALHAAGVRADELGLVIVATSTPDHPQPATASLVQHRIGAAGATAFDLNAVCAGFVYALVTAHALLRQREDRPYALVVGVDVYSRIVDPTDRRTAVLFGDGAGAVVLGPTPAGRGILAGDLVSFGDLHELIRVPAGGSRLPPDADTVATNRHWFEMDGRAVRAFVEREVPPAITRFIRSSGFDPGDIEHLVPHQANGVMLREMVENLGLPGTEVHLSVERHGNTGAASIALALDEANRSGRLSVDDRLLLVGFGGGMSLGLALLTWAAGPELVTSSCSDPSRG